MADRPTRNTKWRKKVFFWRKTPKVNSSANLETEKCGIRRIVLLGKSGSGKSSLCNTLFGEKQFEVSESANSVTKNCLSITKTLKGRDIQLIDTPGLFDTNMDKEELKSALLRCITECAPGPHAFLLVFKVDRFTPQEQQVVDLIVNEYFGEEALKYTTVVFTHGNQLKKGKKLEEWVKDNESLNKLVEKCGGRCCVFDNTYWNNSQDPYRNNQHQVKQLLKTIDRTVTENGGRCYTNELLEEVQQLKEEKKMENIFFFPNLKKNIRMVNDAVYNILNNNMSGVATGAILGVFLGGAAGVALVHGASAVMMCVAGGAGAAVGGTVGAVGGQMVAEDPEEMIDAATHLVRSSGFRHVIRNMFSKQLKSD